MRRPQGQSAAHRVVTGALLALLAVLAPATALAAKGKRPDAVTSRSDAAWQKLDAALRAKAESGSAATVYVWLNVKGDGAAAIAQLQRGHAAHVKGQSLVIGIT